MFAAELGMANKGQAQFIFLGISQTRIVVKPSRFELRAFDAHECIELATGSLVPRGFAVVGLDDILVAEDQFGVIAIGRLCIESVGSGLAVGGVGQGAFDNHSLDFRQSLRAALRPNVLVNDLVWFLRTNSNSCGSSYQEADQTGDEER